MKRIILYIALSLAGIWAKAAIPDDSIRISMVIAGPGAEIWQLEGHAALRVQVGESVDMAINYGIFDFKASNFVYRFVKGETDYMCAAYPFPIFVNEYVSTGRWLHEYPLNIGKEESEALMAYLADNLKPENATYRYNYVKDNCATRPLSLVERAIGDTITIHNNPLPEATTFRDVMRRHHSAYPWYQFGIDLALGSGIDYHITPREKSFAPTLLDSIMATATRHDGQALATGRIELFSGSPEGVIKKATPWPLSPMAVGLYTLILTIYIAITDIKKNRISRWYDTIYMSVTGLAGCVIAFLVFVSVHEATSPNWLLVWLNPFALTVPMLIYIKNAGRLLFYYEFVNFVAILLLFILWPMTGQSVNIAFIPFAISNAILSARYVYINSRCAKKAN